MDTISHFFVASSVDGAIFHAFAVLAVISCFQSDHSEIHCTVEFSDVDVA